MKKLSAPLAFVLSVLLLGASSVLAQSSATPKERPLIERIQGREFPSVFQAWSPAQNIEDASPLHTVARHDLVFNGPEFFGLRWNRKPTGLADGFTAESIGRAKSFRQKLLTLNPNLVLIVEIRYRDAHKSYLPEGHKWWLRNEEGQVVPGWDEGGYFCLDFHNPEFRSQVARQAKASLSTELLYFVKGDDVWFSGWYFIPEGGMPFTLMDLESTWIKEHPGMRIMIEDGAAMFELKWATKPKYRQPEANRVRIPVGRWVHLKARLHLSESADGQVQLWQDERKLIDEQGQTLPLAGAIYDSLEIGISAHSFGPNPATVYVDDVAISDQPID